MCGIIAIWSPGTLLVEDQTVQRLVDEISYRGPDELATDRLSDHCIYGHCRLSIVDVAGGSQPLYSVDGSVVVTFNGEIYNFPELREQLGVEYPLKTKCDTEILIPLVCPLVFFLKYSLLF